MASSKDARRAKVIEVLNKARAMELFAIHQYMNQHYNLDGKDYGKLAADQKRIAIDEMNHAERFAERIKELGGEPGVIMSGKVVPNQDVAAIYEFDSNLEDDTIDKYNQYMKICSENGDAQSAALFQEIIDQEQSHLNYYENTSAHIKNLGTSFLAGIAGTPSSIGGVTKGFVVTGEDG